MTLVMKFGGTSVADGKKIKNAARLVNETRKKTGVAVVVSAMSGVTDKLLDMAKKAHEVEKNEIKNFVEKIRKKHERAAKIAVKENLDSVLDTIYERSEELKDALIGVSITGLTDSGEDSIAAFGEKLSSVILSGSINDFVESNWYYGDDGLIMTSDNFKEAKPYMDAIQREVDKIILPDIKENKIPVVTGFMGCTADGYTTTLGRGSSDHIASILGACLNAKEVQIWTDVDGVLTADPKIVKNSRLIYRLSFKEASELSYFGAKVLHPKSIEPALKKDIPIHILNSFNKDNDGTKITLEAEKHPDVIKGLSIKKDIVLLDIVSTKMLDAHGFLAKVFEIFKKHKVSVDMISTTEVSISLTIDNGHTKKIEHIKEELKEIAKVNVFPKKSVLCVVGEGLRHAPGIAGRVCDCLGNADVNLECISQGASEISISFVIDNKDSKKAMTALHKEFFSGDKNE